MRSIVLACLIAVSATGTTQYSGSKPVPQSWAKGFASITEDGCKAMVAKLAGPEFRGRNPMNGDFNLASGWLAAKLEAIGASPAGDSGTYFHRFTVWDTTPIPTATKLRSADSSWSMGFGPDFSVMATSDMSWPTPKFAFLHVPKGADWSALDFSKLSGRWVFLSKDAAENSDLRKRLNGADGSPRPNYSGLYAANARREGQVVNPSKSQSVKDLPDPRRAPVFALSVSAKTIDQLAERSLARKFRENSQSTASLETTEDQYVVDVEVSKVEYPMVNVVAKIEGSDPQLKSEAVFIGSHLDHLGPQRRGTYFGADDNASGCTANFMIAQAIAANPVKPKRSVYFCFWSSEELGLFGSYAYVQKPLVELKDITAYINMDMVGRNENDPRFKQKAADNVKSVYPSGVAFNSPAFLKILFEQNQFVKLVLKPDVEDRIMRSDSGSFAWKEIPTVKVFTGDHEDYHQPTDTPDKVNYQKMTNIAKWLYLSVQELASARDRPKWEPSPFKANPWQLSTQGS